MEPKIVKMDKLTIIGLTGNGTETGKVWSDFLELYSKNPFPKADENSFEIRFYDGEQKVTQGMEIHVGFLTLIKDNLDGYTTIVIPATDYAVFDVNVAKGYDSENKNMDKWLLENETKYTQLQIEGKKFVVECYNENFKGGDKSDSIIEIWLPVLRNK